MHTRLAAAALMMAPLLPAPAMAQAAKVAPVDPARLAEARQTVDALFPVGTYRRMMGSNFSRMMSGMLDGMMDMPVRDLVAMGGTNSDEVAKMSDATVRQVMEIVDPAYQQRNSMMFEKMMAGMTDVMDGFEPEIRGALVDAYAAKFTTVQLREMNGFFATPTGRLYAENAMTLAMDPAFLDKMLKLAPRIMEAMPAIMAKASASTKQLPPRKSYSTLTQAEKDRLAALLGLAPADTQKAVDALEKQQKRRDEGAS
ncbi:MAG: DUF2059 domain-containing protein [Sphingobium sp.]